jgi:hypothetical protein
MDCSLRRQIFPNSINYMVRKFENWLKEHREFRIIYEVLLKHNMLQEPFFLVPKALSHENIEDADIMWRLDFHKAETKILRGYPKNIIRLLKTFRNGNAVDMGGKNKYMSGLSSYSLKTIVMLLFKERKGVNFINVLRAHFFTKVLFSCYVLAKKTLSYERMRS